MSTSHKIAAYKVLKEGELLMRRRHNYGTNDCCLDLPAAVRNARKAFRIADRQRFA